MKKESRNARLASLVVVVIGVGLAFAGSAGSAMLGGLPLFALAVIYIFTVQCLAFIPAYLLQTEKFFDLTGSFTYISVTILAVILSPKVDGRALLMLFLVIIWAARLGWFLFSRVHKAGKDGRFDDLKTNFWRFLNVWVLQGLWVSFTASAALVVITTSTYKPLDLVAVIGALIWLAGFTIEAASDAQKRTFRADPANKGRFIQTGLWARSRHPNYFGEIVLWLGVAVIALPVLRGWTWAALISPVFVTLLLTRISGIPMLEKRADARWGGQEDYAAYKKNTPVLIPRLW